MNTNKYDEIIKKNYRLKITHLNDQGYGVASNLLINKIIKKKNCFNSSWNTSWRNYFS